MVNVECLNLILTESCNFNCSYCYERFSDCDEMSLDVLEKSIEFGFKNNRSNKLTLWLFGGEALLRIDKLHHAITYAEELNKTYNLQLAFVLFSNGSIYNQEFVDFVQNKNVSIQISFDGVDGGQCERVTKDGKDTEKLVLQNIKKYVDALGSKRVHIRSSLSPEVAKKKILLKTVKAVKDLGIKLIAFNPVQELDWTEDSIKCLDEDLKDLELYYEGEYKEIIVANLVAKSKEKGALPCGAGRTFFAINPLGDIFPCHTIYSSDKHLYKGTKNYPTKIGDVEHGIEDDLLSSFLEKIEKYMCAKCNSTSCNYCLAVHLKLDGLISELMPNSCRVFKLVDSYAEKFTAHLMKVSTVDIEYYLEIFNCFLLLKSQVQILLGVESPPQVGPTAYDLAIQTQEEVNNNIAAALLDITGVLNNALQKKEEVSNV